MPYLGIIIFLALVTLLASFFIVKQETAVIVERLGKFHSVRHAGLQLKIPYVDRIAKRLNLRIQQLDVMIDTKTLDNVFVKMKISVQFQKAEKVLLILRSKTDLSELKLNGLFR